MINRTRDIEKKIEPVTLKAVAKHVGLTAGTISAILNRAPQSRSIPQQTKDRVFEAARSLNYRPNPFAQALRQRGFPASGLSTIANGSRVLVFDGAEDFRRAVHALRQAGLSVPGDVGIVGDDIAAAY
jgi:DNA-binding LacI/PurR family transcriptional regulator